MFDRKYHFANTSSCISWSIFATEVRNVATLSFSFLWNDILHQGGYICALEGRGGDQVVSVLAFYSDNPSLNTAEGGTVFSEISVFEKSKNKEIEAGVYPFLKNMLDTLSQYNKLMSFAQCVLSWNYEFDSIKEKITSFKVSFVNAEETAILV